jgi:hypothetical protein
MLDNGMNIGWEVVCVPGNDQVVAWVSESWESSGFRSADILQKLHCWYLLQLNHCIEVTEIQNSRR